MTTVEIAPGAGTQADFARAQGWEKSYVTKLKKEGRLVFTADGLVDFAASLQAIKRSSGAPERAAEQVQGLAFSAAADEKKFYEAKRERLAYEREVGELLPRARVEDAWRHALAGLRATLEALPARSAASLAALAGDERRIQSLLEDRIRTALVEAAGAVAKALEDRS